MLVSANVREALLHVVKNLRAAPAVLAELGRMLIHADLDLAEVIALLKRDAALTSRTIRLANSALYGAREPIGSLEEALARVGFNEVYRLTGLAAVVEFAAADLPLYGVSAGRFRQTALFNALVMERLAIRTGSPAGEAYTTGLLRAVGKVALDRIAPPALLRAAYSPEQHGPVAEWERDQFGVTSCEAAAMVLEEWRFPGKLVEAIRSQYVAVARGCTFGFLLHGALAASERAGYGLPGEHWYWSTSPQKLAAAGCAAEELTAAAAEAAEIFAVTSGLVG